MWCYIDKNGYQIFYIPSVTDTFIHIYNSKTKKNVGTYLFDNEKKKKSYIKHNSKVIELMLAPPVHGKVNQTLSKMYPNEKHTKEVYQIVPEIFYDIHNGNLIVEKNKKNIVYSRKGKHVTKKSPNISSVKFHSWIFENDIYMILYISYQKKNIIVVFQNYSEKFPGVLQYGNFSNILGLYEFNENGLISYPSSERMPHKISFSKKKTKKAHKKSITAHHKKTKAITHHVSYGKKNVSDYYLKFLLPEDRAPKKRYNYFSDDYILKTQIVPPVCPACPQCPGSGCSKCNKDGHKKRKYDDDDDDDYYGFFGRVKKTFDAAAEGIEDAFEGV